MLVSCSRCQFSVPSNARFCSICGNNSPGSQLPLRVSASQASRAQSIFKLHLSHPLKVAGLLNLSKSLGCVLAGAIRSELVNFGKELKETSVKARRAARSIAKLILTDGKEEYVLDYDQQIRLAEREFAPPLAALSEVVSSSVLVDFAEAIDRRDQKRQSKMQEHMEASMLKKQLEELKSWFENYGKDGLILKSEPVCEDREERRSA